MTFFIFAESEGFTFTVHPWEQRGGWGDAGKIAFTVMWPCIVTVPGAPEGGEALTLQSLFLMKQYLKLCFWSSRGRWIGRCLQ